MSSVQEMLEGAVFIFITGIVVVIFGRPLAEYGELNLVPIGYLLIVLGVLTIIAVLVALIAKVVDSL